MSYCSRNNDGICEACGLAYPDGRYVRECLPGINWQATAIAASFDNGDWPQPVATPTHGPGTELSKLLKRFGIEPTPTCQCREKAAQMDAWGPDECERPERIDEVVAVMRDEATARGLPFLDVAGRMLVRRAIRNAKLQRRGSDGQEAEAG